MIMLGCDSVLAIDAEEVTQGGHHQEERWWEHDKLGTKGMD